MEAARSALIAGIAICGLAVVVLSFWPWITFETSNPSFTDSGEIILPPVSQSLSGLDISRWRDVESVEQAEAHHDEGWCSCEATIGDGYFTAALGLVLIASAGIARLGGKPALGGGIATPAGLAVVAIAGYNAIADWSAIIVTNGVGEVADGTIQPALYALIAVGAIAAIVGSAVWTISRPPEPTAEEAYDYDEDEDPTEGTEAWA